MTKSALEVIVAQHTKDIDNIDATMTKMVEAVNGLRLDMSQRGEAMLSALNTQNTLLIKTQTDHEAKDIERFGHIETRMAYYVGGGAGIAVISSLVITLIGVYFGHH